LIPTRVLGLGEQLAYLRLFWPSFRSKVRAGTLSAIGELQPSVLSDKYTVEVRQPGGRAPEIRVLSPELRRADDGEEIPHMYAQERLCLFLPGSGEWKPSQPIAHTILPWAAMWLYFYEVWHATGEWLGGGVHADIPITIQRNRYEPHC